MNIFVSVFPHTCGKKVRVVGLGSDMTNITVNPEIECKFSNTEIRQNCSFVRIRSNTWICENHRFYYFVVDVFFNRTTSHIRKSLYTNSHDDVRTQQLVTSVSLDGFKSAIMEEKSDKR